MMWLYELMDSNEGFAISMLCIGGLLVGFEALSKLGCEVFYWITGGKRK